MEQVTFRGGSYDLTKESQAVSLARRRMLHKDQESSRQMEGTGHSLCVEGIVRRSMWLEQMVMRGLWKTLSGGRGGHLGRTLEVPVRTLVGTLSHSEVNRQRSNGRSKETLEGSDLGRKRSWSKE